MKTDRRNILILGIGVTALVLLLSMAFTRATQSADRGLLNLAFHLRGEQPVDSSVAILYFSSDDLSILGDLPLKRSYYALIVNALHDIGASAIGFDIGFAEHDPEHEEYDRVFTGVVKNSGNVVLGGYFRIVRPGAATTTRSPLMTKSLMVPSEQFPVGESPEFPFPELLASAAGFGHTYLDTWNDLPVAIRYGDRAVPALPVELLRVAKNTQSGDAGDVTVSGSSLVISGKSGTPITIPFGERGEVLLNYRGNARTLPTISAISFLKAYDMLKAGGAPQLDIAQLKGKIVLIGIIAEGRSAFVPTPFDPQFPVIGIHAVAIQNALEGSFLSPVPSWLVNLISALAGIFCTLLLLPDARRYGNAGVAVLILLVVGGYFALFAGAHIFLPLARPLFVVLAVPFSLLLYTSRQVRRELRVMTTENTDIHKRLLEKENVLSALERELSEGTGTEDASRAEIIADVKRFKEEIRQLKLQTADAQPANEKSGSHDLQDFHGILYHPDGPMAAVVDFVKMISASDAPVLILGESGTGKELIARAIHQSSGRKDKPFIAVNCGALTETLLESELFGHEKGSFTGAVREKPGRFEIANKGVIFLDEVGETSEAFQVKLLRVLQEGVYERVGGVEPLHTDVRVIAATNREMKKAVAERKFREDLYYRLNVFTVNLPPLRERKPDLPPLIHALVAKESMGIPNGPNSGSKSGLTVSIGLMDALQNHSWHGNIRELQSVVKRAVILARAEGRTVLQTKDLPDDFPPPVAASVNISSNIEETILSSLRAKQFSRSAITETAEELGGLNRGTVAEYFRGECFRLFTQNQRDLSITARAIAGAADEAILAKAEKKLVEYLKNAIENVNSSIPLTEVKLKSRPKYKNLAQRYHPALDEIIESYYRNEWSFDKQDKSG